MGLSIGLTAGADRTSNFPAFGTDLNPGVLTPVPTCTVTDFARLGGGHLFNTSEAKARKELIDPALLRAGWDVTRKDQVGLEIPVDGTDPAAWKALVAKLRRIKDKAGDYSALVLPSGISDYALYRQREKLSVGLSKTRSANGPKRCLAACECSSARFHHSNVSSRELRRRSWIFCTRAVRPSASCLIRA